MGYDWQRILDGPRGRELCLRMAMAVEEPDGCSDTTSSLASAVFRLDIGAPYVSLFGAHEPGGSRSEQEWPLPTPSYAEAIKKALAQINPLNIGQMALRDALAETVASARYWQEHDPLDEALAAEESVNLLRPWARLLASNRAAQWWFDAADLSEQYVVYGPSLEGKPPDVLDLARDVPQGLREASRQQTSDEISAAKRPPRRPEKAPAGAWWSTPGAGAYSSRMWPKQDSGDEGDAEFVPTPIAAYLLEDTYFEPDEAQWRALRIPQNARVLELVGVESWVQLCRKYPQVVTHSRRGTWYHLTGRDDAWVTPDWWRVAQRWDAIHLPVTSYLELAGRVLNVDDDAATMMAGWSPDETRWLINMTWGD